MDTTINTVVTNSEQVIDHAATLLLIQQAASSRCIRNGPRRWLGVAVICFVAGCLFFLVFVWSCRLVSLNGWSSWVPLPLPPAFLFICLPFLPIFFLLLFFFSFFFPVFSLFLARSLACWFAYVPPPHSLRSASHGQITCTSNVYLCFGSLWPHNWSP